jgi:PAS domain S-box-containing protein
MIKIIKSQKVLLLVSILASITFLVTVVSFLMIYNASKNTIKSVLTDIAQTEKSKIIALHQHSINESEIIKILNNSFKIHQSIGETGEFVIGKKVNNKIEFIFKASNNLSISDDSIINSLNLASPVKLAVERGEGFVEGKDYKGNKVFAGYTYFKEFGWGIVAKIDASEFNQPFISAGIVAICLAIIFIILGSFLFIKLTNPLLKEIIESNNKFKTIFDDSADGILILDLQGNIIEVNKTLCQRLEYSKDELLTMSVKDLDTKKYADKVDFRLNILAVQGKFCGQTEQVTKSGKIIPIELNATIIEYHDKKAVLSIIRDFTERKEYEKSLFAEKERLRVTLQSIGDGVITTDMNGNVTLMNKVAEELTGWVLSEAINQPLVKVFNIINQQTRLKCENPAEKVLQTGEIIGLANHTAVISKHGIEKIIADSGAPIRNNEGKIFGVVLVFRDETEKYRIQKKIKESQEKFHSLFESMVEGVALHELVFDDFNKPINYRIIDINPAYQKHTGFIADHIIGKLASEAYSTDVPPYLEEYSSVALNGKTLYFETYFQPLERHFKIKVFSTGLNKFATVFEDITEHKNTQFALIENERRLAEAQRMSHIGYSDDDLIEKSTIWSEETYRIFGLENNDAPENYRDFLNLIIEEDRIKITEAVKNARIDFQPFEIDFRILRNKDDVRFIHSKAEVIPNSDGIAHRIFWTLMDVTERILTEDELINAKEKAEESDWLKSAFLANMSHEIRTPMNAILGFSQLLQSIDLKEDERKEYLYIINRRGHDLLNIINDILDISKIEANQIKVHNTEDDLNNLFKEIYSNFVSVDEYDERKPVELRIGNLFPTHINLIADYDRLKQVLNNLIGNALKFTHNGYVEYGCNIKDNKLVEFYIKDTGIGIPENKQHIIFERFRQVEENLSRKYDGTGLGLSISKGLVELMGGKIWTNSVENEGTTFYFNLPLNVVDNNNEYETMLTEDHYDWQNKLILIVEDDVFNSKFILRILSDTKVKYFHAVNGKNALEIYNTNPNFDLVLMDIRLPDLSGYEVTKKIIEINPKALIIAQTAYATAEDRLNSQNAGCIDFISKPFNKEELLKLMDKYLQ